MSHHCKAAVVTCEDFRLHQRKDGRNYIAEFIKKLKCDADLITRAGGVQDLFRPGGPNYDKSVFRDLEVSTKLHQACEIHLINHTDCGAYGKFGFKSLAEEKEQHIKDLRAARELMIGELPNTTIKLYILELKKGSVDEYKIKKID